GAFVGIAGAEFGAAGDVESVDAGGDDRGGGADCGGGGAGIPLLAGGGGCDRFRDGYNFDRDVYGGLVNGGLGGPRGDGGGGGDGDVVWRGSAADAGGGGVVAFRRDFFL